MKLPVSQSAHSLDLIHCKINVWDFHKKKKKLYRRRADEHAHTHTSTHKQWNILRSERKVFRSEYYTFAHIISSIYFIHSDCHIASASCKVNSNFPAFIFVVCVCVCVLPCFLCLSPYWLPFALTVFLFISTFRRVYVVCAN